MSLVACLYRFNARFQIASTGYETPCWLWTGDLIDGYGRFGVKREDGTWTSAVPHRWVYELLVGPIPPKYDVEHECEVRNCVNPTHLKAVTRRQNMLRAAAAGTLGSANRAKTKCAWGHPFSKDNTRIKKDGGRECITCKRESDRRYYANKKGKL